MMVPPTRTPHISPPITGMIPLTAPPHVCLLVHVAAPLDGANSMATPDPVGDRHWAQANLTEEAAQADGSFLLKFQAANPFHEAKFATFGVAELSDTERRGLRDSLGRDIRTEQPEHLNLSSGGQDASNGLRIPARSHVDLELRGAMRDAPADEIYFKIIQRIAMDGGGATSVGSLGVRITGGA